MDDQQLQIQKQRLLDDDGLEPAARQQPLALQARGKVKRSSLTPVRRFFLLPLIRCCPRKVTCWESC
jgi:hypothetical protein